MYICSFFCFYARAYIRIKKRRQNGCSGGVGFSD